MSADDPAIFFTTTMFARPHVVPFKVPHLSTHAYKLAYHCP